jgi:hypothetical protein
MNIIKRELVSKEGLTSLWRWFPVAIREEENSPVVWWNFAGDRRFTEPFFEDTFTSIPPDSRLSCKTSPESLAQFSGLDCLEPSAFIFHTSRCGSTLLTQLLATLPRCIVIAESPAIDSSLNLCLHDATQDRGVEILKGVVRALGQRRNKDERYLFIKLDSWHIIHLPLIRMAFPDTPCFLIYRNPSEIFLSHRRQRGSQMVPGLLNPEMVGLDSESTDTVDPDAYCLKVLSSFFRSATLHAKSEGLLLINYSQLPVLIWTRFAQFFSISLSASEVRFMKARSTRHSKHPHDPFSKDRHPQISDAYTDVLRKLENDYNELEEYRLNQNLWRSGK